MDFSEDLRMNLFFIGIFILLLGGFLSVFFKADMKLKIISIFCLTGLTAVVQPALSVLLNNSPIIEVINFNGLIGNVPFVIDQLSAFFILVISVMSLTSVCYANGYLKPYFDNKNLGSHCVFLPVLILAMLLVVTVQNAVFFLIVWELMSVSSFFLVIFESDKEEVLQAGIKYLVYMHVSLLFIMIAFIILTANSGSLDFNSFKNIFENNAALTNIIFLLSFIGFGTKAGFLPLHSWLPDAHPQAPSHVSGLMSGVMIKTGIYGILRMLVLIQKPTFEICAFILIISVVSGIYGVCYAIAQHDLKRLLAYHSIENIGIIGIGTGVGCFGLYFNSSFMAALGFLGGILHILNHSIFKEILFFSAGSVYLKTHTKNLEILGGLIKKMPLTALFFLTGAVAICGLPPLNGFISEFLIYMSMLSGLTVNNIMFFIINIISLSGLAIIGTLAILCFTKAFCVVFLGNPKSEKAERVESDASKSMLLSMAVLAGLIFVIGLFPQKVLLFFHNIMTVFNVENCYSCKHFEIMRTISYICLALIGVTAFLLIIQKKTDKKIEYTQTWGCGYDKPNAKMQYTASSYASPFLSMIKPLFIKKFDVEKPADIFPKHAHFSMHVNDIEEENFVKPLVEMNKHFLAKFEKIQSGNLQQYILYGLIFLIIILVFTMLWR